MNTGDRSTYSMTPSQAMESLLADVRRTRRSSTDDSYSMFRMSPEQVIGEHTSHPTTDVASRIIQYDTIVSEGLVGQGSHRFLSNAHSCEMETYSMDQQCSNLADSESSSYAESSTATVTYSMTRSSSMSSVKRRPTSMSSSLGRAARNIQYVERSPEITSDVLGVPYSMIFGSLRHSGQHNLIIFIRDSGRGKRATYSMARSTSNDWSDDNNIHHAPLEGIRCIQYVMCTLM